MTYTFTAGATITQGAVVKLTGDFTVEVATAATDNAIGIALQGADSGETVPVELYGQLVRAYAGATISAGDYVIPTTAGDVIPATLGDTSKLIALEPAAASGDEIRLMVYDNEPARAGIESVMMSFETGEQTATKIYFPYAVTITKIRGIVMKAIAGTDNGTITGANATGASTGGVITATASDALNTEYAVTPTDNNTVAAGSYYKLTSAKTTAGGKVLVTLEYSR